MRGSEDEDVIVTDHATPFRVGTLNLVKEKVLHHKVVSIVVLSASTATRIVAVSKHFGEIYLQPS